MAAKMMHHSSSVDPRRAEGGAQRPSCAVVRNLVFICGIGRVVGGAYLAVCTSRERTEKYGAEFRSRFGSPLSVAETCSQPSPPGLAERFSSLSQPRSQPADAQIAFFAGRRL
jgi:hypothetical protein